MKNFNTNQTRHFYVAGAVNANLENNLDIALKQTATGEMYFVYKNADGLVTRSDTFDPKKIKHLHYGPVNNIRIPVHRISIADGIDLTAFIGKTVECIITVHEAFDYDSTYTINASFVANAANTTNEGAFLMAAGKAIATAVPARDKNYPVVLVSSQTGLITPTTVGNTLSGDLYVCGGVQKYVRGKLSGEPCPLTIAFRVSDGNYEDVAWGTDVLTTAAALSTEEEIDLPDEMWSYPGAYVLADLEYFALGERGDVYRGAAWPNEYNPTYVIDTSGNTGYGVLSIEYYWNGNAENVQKSPRMIQVIADTAGATNPAQTFYNTILTAMN